MKCPECDAGLGPNATYCRCGWTLSADKESDARKWVGCDRCGGELFYPNRADPRPAGNFIVGRSRSGGYICQVCYERGETFDYRDKAAADFSERHHGDEWAMLLSATHQLKGAPKADYADVMGIMKKLATKGAFGKLPYDPTVRERPDYEPGMAG